VVSGVLVHGLDYDDTHLGGVVHATTSLWPTVLAVGARQGASGAEALEADIRRKYDTNAARALAAPRARRIAEALLSLDAAATMRDVADLLGTR